MKTWSFVLIGFSWTMISLATIAARAADFNELEGKAFQHAESGWIFAQRVGDFEREKNPELYGASRDAVAQYKDPYEDNATVYVYSPQSIALDASYSGAKSAIEDELKKYPLSQSF